LKKNSQKELASEGPLVDVLGKAAAEAKTKRRKRDAQPVAISLEAHQPTSSLTDVSIIHAHTFGYAIVILLFPPFLSTSDAEISVSWRVP
jgi:hypothetical protein